MMLSSTDVGVALVLAVSLCGPGWFFLAFGVASVALMSFKPTKKIGTVAVVWIIRELGALAGSQPKFSFVTIPSISGLQRVVVPGVKAMQDYVNEDVWNVDGTVSYELAFAWLKTNLDFMYHGLECTNVAVFSALEEGWCQALGRDRWDNLTGLSNCLNHLMQHKWDTMRVNSESSWQMSHIRTLIRYRNALVHKNARVQTDQGWMDLHKTACVSRLFEICMELLQHLEDSGYQSGGFVASHSNLKEWRRLFEGQKGLKRDRRVLLPNDALCRANFFQADSPTTPILMFLPLQKTLSCYSRLIQSFAAVGLAEICKGVCTVKRLAHLNLESPCLFRYAEHMLNTLNKYSEVLGISMTDLHEIASFLLQQRQRNFALKECHEGEDEDMDRQVMWTGMALMILLKHAHYSSRLQERVAITQGKFGSQLLNRLYGNVRVQGSAIDHVLNTETSIANLATRVGNSKRWRGEFSTFLQNGMMVPASDPLTPHMDTHVSVHAANVSMAFIDNFSNLLSQVLARVKTTKNMSEDQLQNYIHGITWPTERGVFYLAVDA